MINFVVDYRSAKLKTAVSPASMKSYVLSLQRTFDEWGFKMSMTSKPIFNHRKYGLKAVCDNFVSEQQSEGNVSRQHNVLPRGDIIRLLRFASCSKSTPRGYLNRLVLIVGVTLGIRTSALWGVQMRQFTKIEMGGKKVWRFREQIGSRTGESKTARGGWSAAKYRPTEIEIWDVEVLDGSLNVYQEIDSYMCVRAKMEKKNDRFFFQPSRKRKNGEMKEIDFWQNSPVRKNSFSSI